MTATLTITLDSPIVHVGGSVTELVLREPTVEEVLKAEEQNDRAGGGTNGFRAYQLALLGKVTGLKEDLLTELPYTRHREAMDFLSAFRAAGNAPVVVAPGDTKDISLDPPVEAHGRVFDCLTLAEPKLAHVIHAERSQGSGEAGLIRFARGLVVAAAEITLPAANLLPISKLNEAAAFLAGFTNAGPEAGDS